jgi:RNA polymerase sigma-70 factor (ECF subfamily)
MDNTSVSLLCRIANAPAADDWGRLDDLYRPLLRAWMVRAGFPASDVDDLVQDVLMVVFRKIGCFERRRKGAFRAWLKKILTNQMRHHFRRQKYRPTAVGGSDFQVWIEELESPDSALSRLWDQKHNEHVLKTLMKQVQGDFEPATWQAFLRHALEAEPAEQVAQTLGLSRNSVLLAKSRVLRRLREVGAGLVE